MDDKHFMTEAIANLRGQFTQLVALLEPTMDDDHVMTESIANVRGHLTHLESLFENDDHHIASNGDQSPSQTLLIPDTKPGDRRDNIDTPLPETRPPYPPDQNPPWHTRTNATPTHVPAVIPPAH
jgi:hypothetical protein